MMGAIYNDGGVLSLTNCKFIGNKAMRHGGAIFNSDSSKITKFVKCTFDGNSAGSSGGAIFNEGMVSSVLEGDFVGNVAKQSGGAFSNNGGFVDNFEQTTFKGNKASGSDALSIGGAVFIGKSKLVL